MNNLHKLAQLFVNQSTSRFLVVCTLSIFSAVLQAQSVPSGASQVGDYVRNPQTGATAKVIEVVADTSGNAIYVLTDDNNIISTQTTVGDRVVFSEPVDGFSAGNYEVTQTVADPSTGEVVTLQLRQIFDPVPDPLPPVADYPVVSAGTSSNVDDNGDPIVPPTPPAPEAVNPVITTGIISSIHSGAKGGDGDDGYGIRICCPWDLCGCATIGYGGSDGKPGQQPRDYTLPIPSSHGQISSTANGVDGIKVGRIGGAGGNGGDAYGNFAAKGGGKGGAGGNVNVTNSVTVSASGENAYGMYIFSAAGAGGAGGTGYIFGTGGSGSGSTVGGTVNATNNAAISTAGNGGHAIRGYSTGGSSGSGGDSWGIVGSAGSGGSGGSGGAVIVVNNSSGVLETTGGDAHGILAQSIGGSGGDSGAAGGVVATGGSGAAGGNGGAVSASNRGSITTGADGSKGILAQSIGGGGGSGGDVGGLVALSGDGAAAGGNGNTVSVTNHSSGRIITYGDRADAIYAQSIGGGGGSGGGSGGLVASSSGGGGGGTGGTVNVTNHGDLTTTGSESRGIFAQSVGGGGGDGGGSGGLVALAGDGGGSGRGGAVNVNNSGTILTGTAGSGSRSHAVFAQSVGGGGGNGAAAGGLVALAGDAGGGGVGVGGRVSVTNSGVLQTQHDNSFGIFAQSVGGGGGSGGGSGGLVALGGQGGAASDGGIVIVQSTSGSISTFGEKSGAIYAQSVGGGGGRGAAAGGLVAVSSAGGGAGNGNTVTVNNGANLQTEGTESNGIFAQSVGGGGGSGGGAGGLVAVSGGGGGAGFGQRVDVDNTGQILTGVEGITGKRESSAIYAQSVGGGGGNGAPSGGLVAISGDGGGGLGKGGAVDVENSGLLRTYYDESFGIFAQSVGGGGGSGGGSGGLVALGGQGGGAAPGDTVDVRNQGDIFTYGNDAGAIYAQSVGGGGGRGAAAGGLVAVSSSGGGAGNGGAVTVTNNGNLLAAGGGSNGIFAQSIGGGGGMGGESGGLVALSGDGGGAGFGETVTVRNTGQIFTGIENVTGKTGSSAIYAQSIGGGGGKGAPSGGLVAVPGNGGGGEGKGGVIDVFNSGLLRTYYEASFGIFAQSVGGGGGSGGGSGGLVALGGKGGGAASGDTVGVENEGNILTYGKGSDAIYAQSVGGGGGRGAASGGIVAVSTAGGGAGNGGQVTVTNSGNLLTDGEGAKGIFAQSVGGGGGTGGESGGMVALSGDGGGGGVGQNVTVINTGTISTSAQDHQKSLSVHTFTDLENGTDCLSNIDCEQLLINRIASGAVNVDMVASDFFSLRTTGANTVEITIYDRSASATAIYAQSVGGGGGTGTPSGGFVALSGGGGGAGRGGVVAVTNSKVLRTVGSNSYGIFAQSIGGGGGESSAAGGLAAVASDGGGAGFGGVVTVNNNEGGDITTFGVNSTAIFAQSVGGGGGVGDPAGGLGAVGGDGGDAAYGGTITVTNDADLSTAGDYAKGIMAQSIGGGGGSAGVGGGIGAVGGEGGSGKYGGDVSVINSGNITTTGRQATGIYAQSIGGGGGSAGDGGGLFTWGGDGAGNGQGSTGGNVTVVNNGTITTHGIGAKGIFAESVGGGGGDGGSAYGVFVTVGGDGGQGSQGGAVDVTHGGLIHTYGIGGMGIHAQSVGGSGGDGGSSYSGSVFFGYALGGSGGSGALGGNVDVTLGEFLGAVLQSRSMLTTEKDRATGILAQSIGGGGGSGGRSVQASAGAFINMSVSIGGTGGTGSQGGIVNLDGAGDVLTKGDVSPGVVLQSVGGGGGNGGSSVSVSVAAGQGVSVAGSVALGGDGGAAGDGGTVTADVDANIETQGAFSTGFLAQSVGGGGGNGGNAISVAASFADGVAGAVGVALGGEGSSGGTGGSVDVEYRGTVRTAQAQSDGLVIQSVGGGGGNGGTTIAASLGAAGGAAANVSVALGGDGGAGGTAGDVAARVIGNVTVRGDGSDGLVVQAIGGGGGNSGVTVGAGLAGAGGMAASVNVALGGQGGSAGTGGIVDAYYDGILSTLGNSAIGILAQSVGGGGGNAGGTIAAGLAGSGGVAGAVGVALGGDGGGGGSGGRANTITTIVTAIGSRSYDFSVSLETNGSVSTDGINSAGIIAQSIGGGGGNGGYAISGGLAGAGVGAGTISVGLGGDGAGGGVGMDVFADIESTVLTQGESSDGVLVQTVGGGGGNGGLSVAGGLAGSGVGAGAINVAIGGSGGSGAIGGDINATASGTITTLDDQSNGFVAQSIGGGGGNGGGNVAASLTGGSTAAVGINVGLGGTGGTAAHGGSVVAATSGNVVTYGQQSVGILAQSVGGGGGNGGFNVAAGISGAGVANAQIGVGLGGDGGAAGDGGEVSLTVNNDVFTFGGDGSGAVVGSTDYLDVLLAGYADPLNAFPVGDDAEAGAVIAQSIGGGGGNGGLNVTASAGGSGVASGGINVGLGGDGESGGNGGSVTAAVTGQIFTVGNGGNGVLAQSVGGGGGNGALNVSGTISGAGVGNGAVTVGLGGSGDLGGTGDAVDLVVNGPVTTFGDRARGVIAQSIGGGGGNGAVNVGGTLAGAGTGSGDITVTIGGSGGAGGSSGRVDARVIGNIYTAGDFSDGYIAQTIGGGGGNSAINVGAAISGAGVGNGSGKIALGGSGGAASNSNIVDAYYDGVITTFGNYSRGMLVQSVGGGGGNAGGNVAAGISGAGTGNGDLTVGVGGDGGGAGDGGLAGVALAVTAQAKGQILTYGNHSGAFTAQSIGGGGGNGGYNVTASGSGAGTGAVGVGVGLGGDGFGGGAGKGVDADISANIWTTGNYSGGVLAQSVGGGGGNGGFNVTAVGTGAGTGAGNVAVGLGGKGAKGGVAGQVDADATGTIATKGDNSAGFIAQSIGGGGGNGGFNVSVSLSGAGQGSGAINVGLGGNGDEGGAGGEVYASTSKTVTTEGDNSAGVVAQSIGGGGGNGGFNVGVSLSGAGKGSGSVGVGLGGGGAGGGSGQRVELTVNNDVSTQGKNSAGIIAQSLGGGGGNGGFNVVVPVSGAGTGSGAVGVGLGGDGGTASSGGTVIFNGEGNVVTGDATEFADGNRHGSLKETQEYTFAASGDDERSVDDAFITSMGERDCSDTEVDCVALVEAALANGDLFLGLDAGEKYAIEVVDSTTVNIAVYERKVATGDFSPGIVVQSIGGGGGNAGFDVSAAVSGAGKGSGALTVGLGGDGEGGGNGGIVDSLYTGAMQTAGFGANGLTVQSIGGGGGNGAFSVSAAISGAGKGSGAGAISLGGSGAGGGNGLTVDSAHSGTVYTLGDYSNGVVVQSVGGGGGNGGFSVAGGISVAKSGSAALTIGIGGSGGAGGSSGSVTGTQTGNVTTLGDFSSGVIVQSLGGGGGNGGFSVSGNIAAAKSGSGALGVGIGGMGGDAAFALDATSTVTGLVQTTGNNSDGVFTQSLGGGGGNGGFNVTGVLTASQKGSGNLGVGVGGFGGTGGYASAATSTVIGGVLTSGNNSNGVITQSIGGGGGNGGFNVTGSVNITTDGAGGNLGVGIGGFGGDGGNAGIVDSTVTMTDEYDRISTLGNNSVGIIAQSVGGGGGNGATNVTGTLNATSKSGGSVGFGLGGFGAGAGNGKAVTLNVDGLLVTQGTNSHGILAQSVGGSGGSGGTNVTGSIGITKSAQSATQVGVAIGIGGFGGNAGTSGDVTVTHDGSIYAGMGARELIAEVTDATTGEVTPAYYVLRNIPGIPVPESQEKVLDEDGEPVLDDEGEQVYITIPEYYADYTGDDEDIGADSFGASGLIAQSIGGGGGAGGVNVSGSISAAFGDDASGYGIVVGVGGFGGAGGDAGNVDVDVTSGGEIVAAGTGRSGVLAQSVGGGGGDGGTNVSGSISTDAPLLVGVGGFGANAGKGKNVTVDVAANIDVLGQGTLEDASDELVNSEDKLDDTERRPDRMSAGVMAQSIGGGGGNGGLNVSGAIVTSKSTGIPSVNVGIGGYGGDGATSGDVTVVHEGTITMVGEYAHGILAQSIGGGGGNGATNISGQFSKASGKADDAGGNTDISIVVGVGGSGGDGAKSGDVSVTQLGEIITKGDHSRGIFAQSISDGGGVGGLNVSALLATKTSPIMVGVGGSGGDGASAGNVAIYRGDANTDAGAIVTDGLGAHGIEASTISGGGGDAGANFVFGVTQASSRPGKAGFSANIGIGGGGGQAADAAAAWVDNNSNIATLQDQSHGIFAQSIGGGGGNANFNVALNIAKGGSKPEEANGTKSVSIAVGGATGDGGNGGQVDAYHRGDITTLGNVSYGVLAQSIGGGGGNAGLDFNMILADGGKLGVKIGREGGTGGHAGTVTLDSNGTIITRGDTSYGLLAQSIGNGGGNSSASKVSVDKADTGDGTNGMALAVGIKGGNAGFGGDVLLKTQGAVVTDGDDSRGVFAQSVGGGGGNAGGASTFGKTAGSSIALGASGGEGGYGGAVEVESFADVFTAGDRAAGILAQSLGGGGGTGSMAKAGGITGANSGLNIAIGGDGGKGNYGGAVDVDNYGVILTEGVSSIGVLAQSIGDGGGKGGAAFTGVLLGNDEKEPIRVNLAFGGNGGEGGYGSAVTVNNHNGIGTLGYRSSGIFAQSVGGAGGIGGVSTVMTASGAKGSQNLSFSLGGKGAEGASGGSVSVNNLLVGESVAQISTYGNSAHGIAAMSIGGGGGDGGGSYILNRKSAADEAMNAKYISIAVGGDGGEGGIGGIVNVTNDGTIITRGDRSHGIYATSIGGGGGVGGASFIGEYVLGLPSLSGGNSANVQLAIGGQGGEGNTGGNVRVENSGTITTNGEQAYGIYAQSVGGGGGDGGLAITASKDIVNYKEPLKSLMKMAIGGFGGDANNGGDVEVVHTGEININGKNSIGIFAESIGGAGGSAGTSISSPVWMAADLLLDLVVGGGDTGQAGDVNVEYTGTINIAETATGSQGVVIQKVNGGGGNSNFYYDMSQQAKELGEGGYDLPDNSGLIDQTFASIEGILKAGGEAIGPDVDLDLGDSAPTTFSVDGSIFGSAANGWGSVTQSITGGGGRSATTLVVQQDGSETATDEVDLVTDDPFLTEEARALLNRFAQGEELGELGDFVEADLAERVGERNGATADLVAELGGTDVTGAAAGDVDFSQSGALVMLGEDSQGAVVQSIGGGGGQMEVRIYTSPEVPNPAPFDIVPTIAQAPVVAVASNAVSSPMNYRALSSQLGTIGGTDNDGGTVQVSRTGETVTRGDYSPGVVAQSIGGGGGQLSVSGMDVLFTSIGGTNGASGDAGEVVFDNAGDLYTAGRLSHGVVVQSIGGGGGLVVSDTDARDVFVARNTDSEGSGGNVNYTQTGFVMTEGEGAYGVAMQSIGGGGGIVDNVFFGSAGGAGTAGDLFLSLAGSATVGGNNGIALLAQSEARDGAGDIDFDVSGTVKAAGDFSTGVLGITRSSANSGDLGIQVGGNAIASGTSAVGIDALLQGQFSVGEVVVGVGGNVLASGNSSTGLRGGSTANSVDNATELMVGGSAVATGIGAVAIDLAIIAEEYAGGIGVTIGRHLGAAGSRSAGVVLFSTGVTAGSHGVSVGGQVEASGNNAVALSATNLGSSSSSNIWTAIGGGVTSSGGDSTGLRLNASGGGILATIGDYVLASGNSSAAVRGRSPGEIGLDIGSALEASGDEAVGLDLVSQTISVVIDESVLASGKSASGVLARAAGAIDLSAGTAVQTSGEASVGLGLISRGSSVDVAIGGPVLATADLSSAVQVLARDWIQLSVASLLETFGKNSVGLDLTSKADEVEVDIAGPVLATGDLSSAVRAFALDQIELSVASALEASGRKSVGLDLTSKADDVQVAIAGAVLVNGQKAAGLRATSASGGLVSLQTGSAVIASGTSAVALELSSSGATTKGLSLVIDDYLQVSGNSAQGIKASALGDSESVVADVVLGGSVFVNGVDATGISVSTNSKKTSAGIVVDIADLLLTSGQRAQGLALASQGADASGALAVTLGSDAVTMGESAIGSELSSSSSSGSAGQISVDIAGLLVTDADSATGLRLLTDSSTSSGSIDTAIGGTLSTKGEGANGLVVNARSAGQSSDVALVIAADVFTEGNGATGADIVTNGDSTGGKITLAVGGSLLALGEDVAGLKAVSESGLESGDVMVRLDGDVYLQGNSSVAMELKSRAAGNAGAVDLLIGTTLSAYGDSARGVTMSSEGRKSSNDVSFAIAGAAVGEGSNLTLIELSSSNDDSSVDNTDSAVNNMGANKLQVQTPSAKSTSSATFNRAVAGDVVVSLGGSLAIAGQSSRGVVLTSSSAGSSGDVLFEAAGSLVANDDDSAIVVARSLGGERSGDIQIDLNGDVAAMGARSTAITAQSSSEGIAGDITIANQVGQLLYVGSGGVGVKIEGGLNNQLMLRGESMTDDGIGGNVVVATTGNDRVENSGVMIGQFDLGAGANRFVNTQNAIFIAGPTLVAGNDSSLVNSGVVVLGDSGFAQSTTLHGNFEQTVSGATYVELDFAVDTIDQILATETAKLDGSVYLTLLNPELVPAGEFSKVLFGGEAGVENAGLELFTDPSVVINYAVDYSSGTAAALSYAVDFSPNWLSANLEAVGDYINDVQNAGSAQGLSEVITTLLYQDDRGLYADSLRSMTPQFFGEQAMQLVRSNQAFANRMLSCKQAGGDYRFTSEGKCAWVYAGFENLEYDEFGTSQFDTDVYAMGAQIAFGEHWFAGIGASHENISGEGNSNAWFSDGTTTQGAVSLKYQLNAWKFAGVLSYATNETETVRNGQVIEAFVARVDRDSSSLGLLLVGSYDFEFGMGYVRPALEIGVTRIVSDEATESGADALNLTLRDSSDIFTWVRPAVETGIEYMFENDTLARFYARVGVQHYLGDDFTEVQAGFTVVDAGVNPISMDVDLGQNAIIGTAGIDVLFSNKMTLQFQYRYETAGNLELNAGSLKFSMPF
jgi:hypothetical protein